MSFPHSQVVFNGPSEYRMTNFGNEFLRPTSTANNAAEYQLLDASDSKTDNKFFGAELRSLNDVPHSHARASVTRSTHGTAIQSIPSTASVIPGNFQRHPSMTYGAPVFGATSTMQSVPSFAATSFSNVSPAVAQPSYSSYGSGSFISAPSGYMGHASSGYVGHVSSGYAAHAAPVAHAAPAYGLSTPCVAAGHGYRPITSLANEPMVPTTFASNANQAQVLDAADGSVDNKFFGSRVVTGF